MSSTGQPLAHYTTLRVGGPADELVTADNSLEALAALREASNSLILAGGSNLVIGDSGFAGRVVHLVDGGFTDLDGGRFQVEAGQNWDEFVRWTVENGYSGVEALSGIPGSAGATPIQNVGAYGQEVSETIESVQVWDQNTDETYVLKARDCGFSYRNSIFKRNPRYFVMTVTFALERSALSQPVRYAELAKQLGVSQGEKAEAADVRDEVLRLRRSKGMVLDPDDHDTWSAGSFFTNPVVDKVEFAELVDRLGEQPVHHEVDEGIKLSAAWLIGKAGFPKGYRHGNAGLSTKHVLALTNRGQASAADIVSLARTVSDSVYLDFGVRLRPEPVCIGISL
ncbi:UDP-N-acetylmuramate dehydrogenase [Haloglycomyces albus]|uniref:UDP-N-acetylmuramate dehydrogenase n=1 Tax=Haloglycomyces albus TaxID=526067 RepID=UPI00046D88F5|nr:UDP-N-acetylmuramate dehydrogenase [Haloglycomyces albus]